MALSVSHRPTALWKDRSIILLTFVIAFDEQRIAPAPDSRQVFSLFFAPGFFSHEILMIFLPDVNAKTKAMAYNVTVG